MRERRDYWSRHIEAWRQSGQSRRAYCEEHALSYWSMRDWIRKLAEPAVPASQRLVELEPVSGGGDRGGGKRPVCTAAVATPACGAVAGNAGDPGEQSMIYVELGKAWIFVRPRGDRHPQTDQRTGAAGAGGDADEPVRDGFIRVLQRTATAAEGGGVGSQRSHSDCRAPTISC